MAPNRLAELREAADLSQRQVADRLGLPTRMVSHYEAGIQMPAHVIAAFAKLFRVTPKELFVLEGKENRKSPSLT